MNLQQAHDILSKQFQLNAGRFYGGVNGLGLGAGLIYSDVRAPIYDPSDNLFDTYETTGYVLTHECDVDKDNQRLFNYFVLICPIITIQALVEEYQANFAGEEAFRGFLNALTAKMVSRVVYLPPLAGVLPDGGIIYLNNITSAHISTFEGRNPAGAVSAYGLQIIDMALTNHLLREKSDRLGLMPDFTIV